MIFLNLDFKVSKGFVREKMGNSQLFILNKEKKKEKRE